MSAIADPIAVALLVADALDALGLRYTRAIHYMHPPEDILFQKIRVRSANVVAVHEPSDARLERLQR